MRICGLLGTLCFFFCSTRGFRCFLFTTCNLIFSTLPCLISHLRTFSFFFCLDLVVTHIVAYALDSGIPAIAAAATLSIIAGVSIVGRLSGGPISDRIGLRKVAIGSLVLVALAMMILLTSQSSWSFYAFTLVFGLGYGLFIILESAMPAELFGTKSL